MYAILTATPSCSLVSGQGDPPPVKRWEVNVIMALSDITTRIQVVGIHSMKTEGTYIYTHGTYKAWTDAQMTRL